jgi:hypothetical protein
MCLILIALSIGFYIVGPKFINKDASFFTQVLLVCLADSLLITLIIIGSMRVSYYLCHDKIVIKKSLHRTATISYDQILNVTEYPNDTIIFMFGTRPSFKIRYRKGNIAKFYRVRVDNHKLFKLVLENEQKIHVTENK